MTLTDEELERLAESDRNNHDYPGPELAQNHSYCRGYRACKARSAVEIEKLEARVKELEKSLEWYKKPEGERNRIQRMNRQ